jgi:hypothetical protein
MAATGRPWLAIGLAAVLLAACTSTEDALIQRGLSPAYAAGYDHGCASGQVAGGGLFGQTQKDESRYSSDSEYTKGWDAGFAKCKRDQEVMEREARARKPSRNK